MDKERQAKTYHILRAIIIHTFFHTGSAIVDNPLDNANMLWLRKLERHYFYYIALFERTLK